jgi:hypothetical protein
VPQNKTLFFGYRNGLRPKKSARRHWRSAAHVAATLTH